MQARIHAEMIKAWADGYEIEVLIPERGEWFFVANPEWYEDMEYRVKPGDARQPRITQRWARIDINPFTNELEIMQAPKVLAVNVVMTFENDDLINVCMIDKDEDEAPW